MPAIPRSRVINHRLMTSRDLFVLFGCAICVTQIFVSCDGMTRFMTAVSRVSRQDCFMKHMCAVETRHETCLTCWTRNQHASCVYCINMYYYGRLHVCVVDMARQILWWSSPGCFQDYSWPHGGHCHWPTPWVKDLELNISHILLSLWPPSSVSRRQVPRHERNLVLTADREPRSAWQVYFYFKLHAFKHTWQTWVAIGRTQ